MYISEDKITEIKEKADIVDVVSDYLSLSKSGSNLVGLCPFHNEKTPSFTVSEQKQFFHCFGCGESGDSITFIMKKENLDFIEAVKFLGESLGVDLEGVEVDQEKLEKKELFYEINREAGRFFHNLLLKNQKALSYLKERNIGHKAIKRFGLGFIPDNWEMLYNHLIKDYKEEDIAELGLISERKKGNGYYDRFRNRIMFPIINRRNKIVGFGGRVMDDSMPKYLNSKESLIFDKGKNLYALNLVNKYSDKKKIILVEGYMDVIALFSKGISYSVASLGTALTETQAKLLKRYGEEVYLSYDSDNAGVKATLRSIDILMKEDVKPKIVRLPEGMDPDDYINEYGKLKFESLLKSSLNYIEFNIELNKDKYDINNMEEKISFTKDISSLIGKVKSPIEQDVYIDKISKDTGISKEAIEKEISDYKPRKARRKKVINRESSRKDANSVIVKSNVNSAREKAELQLVKLTVYDKEYFELIEKELLGIQFLNIELKKIYDIIKLKYKTKNTLDIEKILKLLYEEDINREIIEDFKKTSLEYKPTEIESVVNDLINTVILDRLEEKRRSIIKSIEELEVKEDKTENEKREFTNLCIDLTDLNGKIKSIRYE